MASFLHTLLLFTFISRLLPSSSQLLLPLTKHADQYLTQIHLGTPPQPLKLLVDLAAPFLWTDCSGNLAPYSSTRTLIQCPSIQCLTANSTTCGISLAHSTSSSTPPCTLSPRNAITGESGVGELVEDALSLQSQIGSKEKADNFLFSCAPPYLFNGLAAGARGILGLGMSRISLPSQLAQKLPFSRKFSVCLSRKKGMIFSGQVPIPHLALSKSLVYTPIVGSGPDYLIHINSVRINGKRLVTGIYSPAKISSVVQYTSMESSIYERFIRGFAVAAESMNLTRAPAVPPFEVCYAKQQKCWTAVPVVDLVLQSEMVKWRIYGHNSMVEVGGDVMCLGFLNGGLDLGSSIVIGGHQLEDNLVEFDLESSMLGFSSSLVGRGTSCSDLTYSWATSDAHQSS